MKSDLGDLSIYFETEGAGRPILMLPGQPSDHRIMALLWNPSLPTETAGSDLPRLARHSARPAPDPSTTRDQVIDTMLAFIDAVIPGQRFVLAGYSAGGYLAQDPRPSCRPRRWSVALAPEMKADASKVRLPAKTTIVKNPQLLAGLDPDFVPLVEGLVVVQSPSVMDALYHVLAEGPEPDHSLNERMDAAGPASFQIGAKSTFASTAPPSS